LSIQLKDPARTWDILQSWTQIHQPVGLKITSLRNAIFMTSEDHLQFGTFKFYLEKATVRPFMFPAADPG
ncbi:hypothetical protein B0H15DRAFT_769959, partial [Mycena belliarum]